VVVPSVVLVAREEEEQEEACAMLEYAVKGLAHELYVELLAAFHH
jgi:hypothetical protein